MASGEDESLESLFAAMSLMTFQKGSHFYAKATHIVDPHNFFVVPMQYLYHLPILNVAREQCRFEELQESKTVIYRSQALNRNVRGLIHRINEDKTCKIYALDHGFVEGNVCVERIFHALHEESTTTPSLVRHCELDMCAPMDNHFSDDAIEAFKFYMGTERQKIVIRNNKGDKLSVAVYNSNPDDVATLLALTHYTYLSVQEDVNFGNAAAAAPGRPRARRNLTFTHRELDLGETLTVRIQSGLSLDAFYVTPLWAYREYVSTRADFSAYCKSANQITPEEFVPGAAVGVQEDHSKPYERGIILVITEPNAKAKVKLVDWGTEIVVPIERVRPIKTELYIMTPAHAIYCAAVEGFKAWDNGLSNFLYKGYSLSITVKQVGNGFETPYIVSLQPV